MKKLLLIVFVLISFVSYGQSDTTNIKAVTYTSMVAKGYQFKFMKVDSGAWFRKPVLFSDTAFFTKPAYITNVPANSDSSNRIPNTALVKRMIALGGGGGGGGTDYSGKIDSIRIVPGTDSAYEYFGGPSGLITPRFAFTVADAAAGGDTTVFQTVLDSTGQPNNRVLFSRNNKISSNPKILIDSTNSKLVINDPNVSVGGSSTKLYVNGNAAVTGSATVADDPYAVGWNGSTQVPTKNAVYDKVETKLNISDTSAMLDRYLDTLQAHNNRIIAASGGSGGGGLADSTYFWRKTGDYNLSRTTNFIGSRDSSRVYFKSHDTTSLYLDGSVLNMNDSGKIIFQRTVQPPATRNHFLSYDGGTSAQRSGLGFIGSTLGAGVSGSTVLMAPTGTNVGVLIGTGYDAHTMTRTNAGIYVDNSNQVTFNSGLLFGSSATQNSLQFVNGGSSSTRSILSYMGVEGAGLNNGGMVIGVYGSLTSARMLFTSGQDRSSATLANSKGVMFNSGSWRFGVSSASENASAVVEVASTTQGFLLPRMTAVQASAISSPADGLMVYVTSTDGTFTAVGFWGRVAGTWTKMHL